MEPELVKGRPLSKEETKALLELVQQSKIITNKTTNATNNKLKNEEWSRIATVFNATVTTFRRTPQQLRLKWENLKKNARKRCTKIRMNNLKTGGGRGDYIPPDDILDRVSSLLGSTAVPFGGDSVPLPVDSVEYTNFGDGDGINIEFEVDPIPCPDAQPMGSEPYSEVKETNPPQANPASTMPMGSGPCSEVREINPPRVNPASTMPMGSGPCSEVREINPPRVNLCSTPIKTKAVLFKTPGSGKKRVKDSSKAARDDSIAEYYKLKTELVKSKFDCIQLENERLKLIIEKLNLEIKKLKEDREESNK